MWKAGVIVAAAAVLAGAVLMGHGVSLAASTSGIRDKVRVLEVQAALQEEKHLAAYDRLQSARADTGRLDARVADGRQTLTADRQEAQRLRDENARLRGEIQRLRSGQEQRPSPAQAPVFRSRSGAVTLTFDDSASVERVNGFLDVLSSYGVKSVFCVTGDWAKANARAVQRIRNEGHKLCNHTASHAWLTRLSEDGIRQEIAGGLQSDLMRPPYGAYDARVRAIAASLGYRLYLWSIDTRDWSGVSAGTIVNTVMTSLHPGAVVLMHLHGASTLDALPRVIEGIRAQGYSLGLQ